MKKVTRNTIDQKTEKVRQGNAERMRRFRALHGGRNLQMVFKADEAAAVIYLQRQWGFETYGETVRAALLHLTRLTRQGLSRLELGFEPLPVDCEAEMTEGVDD